MAYQRDMYNVYVKRDSYELRVLRSKKVVALQKAEAGGNWWAKRDREALQGQIDQIDAILESRKLQKQML